MAATWDVGRQSVMAGRPEGTGARAGGSGPSFAPANEKYAVEMTIGRGGMGEILLVTDQDLRRQVAMKVLLKEVADDEQSRLHFVAEAQATSQLEHPGIPPVHDIGIAPDGRLYFTMKLVRGRTLREILHDLAVRRAEVQREWTTHRLVTVMERLCETVQFAHERGVVHRDLKPENVMLGDYGEIHVMDWGLARVVSEAVSSPDAAALRQEAERVRTARTEAAYETRKGAVKGTLPYMAPEQLTGTVDRRTDVFALGLLLYEILTLHPAYDPHAEDLLARLATAEIPPAETRNPRRPVPQALAEACRKATAREPAARFQGAKEMGTALRAWLDGSSERERRHREAEAYAARGSEAVVAYERAKEAVARLETEVERHAGAFKPWQPIVEKRPLLDAKKRLEEATGGVALAFAEALKWFDAALAQEEANRTARSALANLWRGRLDDAERRGDKADAGHALATIRRYDDGALEAHVRGDGAISLDSEPPGAEVTLCRYVERDGILVESDARSLGETPFAGVALPMGAYLCVLKRSGFCDVRYPVQVARNRRWEGRVRMRTPAEIGEGFVVVPGGPFTFGEGKTTKTLDLPDFAIAKYPVTFGEYAEFLAAVERERGVEAAALRVPRMPGAGHAPYMDRKGACAYVPREDLIHGAPAERALRAHGPDWRDRMPVFAVSFDDARAYCAWKSKATGREWRLPTEEEREKAARGVDGRQFPWGDLEDSTLCKCRDSREEQPQPEPVGAYRTAESVYGMGDAAGGVWEWTDSWFDSRRTSRVLRGGSWDNGPEAGRAAYRHWGDPSIRYAFLGFRCARGL